ncbi:MAG: hypothetical protein IPP62_05580 [bacterium]|jgi:hypothetical protein|nr:hypothetical protein [bacterium]
MIRKATILLILAGLVLAAPAGAFFESTPVSARSRAMGEAVTAVPDPAYAAFNNAAWLADVPHGEAGISYVRPFGLSFQDFYTAGAAFPLEGNFGNLGVGISHFKVASGDTSLLKETQVSLAHGFELFSDFHSRVCFGWALNLYSVSAGQSVSGVDPGSDTSVGLDLGLSMLLHKRTRAGFQVRNLNNPTIGIDGEELPQSVTAGIAYEPYDGVITTFEFDNQLGYRTQYHGGIEMTVVPGFALRAGVITDPSRLTGGFGYAAGPVSLDYGFSTGGGTLDTTHQFGLRLSWGGEAP